jgi:hypothetical protein
LWYYRLQPDIAPSGTQVGGPEHRLAVDGERRLVAALSLALVFEGHWQPLENARSAPLGASPKAST